MSNRNTCYQGGLVLRFLLLGSSAASVAAAGILRKVCPNDEITMASADEVIHSRCLLHRFLSGERNIESLDFTSLNFFVENDIKLLTNKAALSVDINKKTVMFTENAVPYDRLLIATGAYSIVPGIPGLQGAQEVYTLGSLRDASVIKKAAERARSIVILGSGLVGMGAAYGLAQSGLAVHVVEMADHIIPAQLDSHVAAKYQERFEEAGVTFHLSKKVIAIRQHENGRVAALEFDDRAVLPCDMIIVATGNRPNTGFLENSGINLNNGVVVDGYLQASAMDVYAAGDVTGITGNWYSAIKQGRIAAHNMANPKSLVYDDKFHATNTLSYFGMTTLSVGKISPPFDGYEVLNDKTEGKYLKLVMKDGIAKGALLFGDISNAGHWKYLIKNAIPLDKLGKSPVLARFADFFEIDPQTAEFRYKVN
jgi:NAD(P)H-nitrite reductase large subunit